MNCEAKGCNRKATHTFSVETGGEGYCGFSTECCKEHHDKAVRMVKNLFGGGKE